MGLAKYIEARSREIGRKPISVLLRAANTNPGVAGALGDAMLAVGFTVPLSGQAGFAKGCAFFLTDGNTTALLGVYSNRGTALSCDFIKTSA